MIQLGHDIDLGRCIRDTPKALLVKLENYLKPIWIPRSVIDGESEVKRAGQEGVVIVQRWWSQANGYDPRRANYRTPETRRPK